MSADDVLRPPRTATHELTQSTTPAFGRRKIQTVRGIVETRDAPGLTAMEVAYPSGEKAVGLMLYDPDTAEGWVTQLSAASARSLAASLLRMADRIEPLVRQESTTGDETMTSVTEAIGIAATSVEAPKGKPTKAAQLARIAETTREEARSAREKADRLEREAQRYTDTVADLRAGADAMEQAASDIEGMAK